MGNIRCSVRTCVGGVALLAAVLVGSVRAEVVITDAPRPAADATQSVAEEPGSDGPGLTHEGFGVRDGQLQGFIINASEETIEDAVAEIRSTSADELLTYWMVRVTLGDMEPGQRIFVRRAYPEWFSAPEKIVVDFDPPENQDTPWPRPVPAKRLIYSGDHSGLTSWFIISPGAVRFSFRHDGDGEFGLDLIPQDIISRTPVVRHSGAGEGSALHAVQERGVYQLAVQAAGAWEVRIDEETSQDQIQPSRTEDDAGSARPAAQPRPIRIEERSPGEISITR